MITVLFSCLFYLFSQIFISLNLMKKLQFLYFCLIYRRSSILINHYAIYTIYFFIFRQKEILKEYLSWNKPNKIKFWLEFEAAIWKISNIIFRYSFESRIPCQIISTYHITMLPNTFLNFKFSKNRIKRLWILGVIHRVCL